MAMVLILPPIQEGILHVHYEDCHMKIYWRFQDIEQETWSSWIDPACRQPTHSIGSLVICSGSLRLFDLEMSAVAAGAATLAMWRTEDIQRRISIQAISVHINRDKHGEMPNAKAHSSAWLCATLLEHWKMALKLCGPELLSPAS